MPPKRMKQDARQPSRCAMRPCMRVRVLGAGPSADRVAAALSAGGLHLAAADDPCDLLITLVEGHGAPAAATGPLLIDLTRRQARLRDEQLRLTPIEFALLGYLAQARRPVSRAELLRELWGHRFDPGTNSVAVHVSRLRGKRSRRRETAMPWR